MTNLEAKKDKVSRNAIANDSILANITLEASDEIPQGSDLDINSYIHPREVHFDHAFIVTDAEKFSLEKHGCHKCSPLTSHFSDIRSNYDTLAEKSIRWVQSPNAIMTNPFPGLKTPCWNPENIAIAHPDTRPRGTVKVSRIYQNIDNKDSFKKIAKNATCSVLRNLRNRPLAVKELDYKIKQDVDNSLLIPLEDFLLKPEVISQGFNKDNIANYLIASAILLVYNPNSTSTKIRLCVDPTRQTYSGQSINQIFKAGHSHIPAIASCLLSSQFYVSHALADISNFYTNCLLDSTGTLLSAVYLQAPVDGSKYPTLNPLNKTAPLKLHCYTGAKFGYRDSGSIACLSKTLLTRTYSENYPSCLHKLDESQLARIRSTLVDSYVDDLFIGTTLKDIQSEIKSPTMNPESDFEFKDLSLTNQADVLTIFETQKTLSVLDFSGFQTKKIKSNSTYVQRILNMDTRLEFKTSKHLDHRPDQMLLKEEILQQRNKVDFFANTDPDDYPEFHQGMYLYLGMVIDRHTDKLSLKPRALCLRKKLKGVQDIILRNLGELTTFLTQGKFTKSHLHALSHGLYCPQQSLTAVYNAVAKKMCRTINIQSPSATWQSKVDPIHYPVITKVTDLYFRTQKFNVDRFCLLKQPMEDTRYYLICFVDGALDFASSAVYILSASKHSNLCKAQILSAATKLMSEEATDEISVPKNETYSLFQGSALLHKVAQLMDKLSIPIFRAILFSDAISSLLSLRRHPAIFKHPQRKWLASANVSLFQTAELINSQQKTLSSDSHQMTPVIKDDIAIWINQKVRCNFADLLTKFQLDTDSTDRWIKLQEKLIQASWLQTHPSTWYKQMLQESEEMISQQSLGGQAHHCLRDVTQTSLKDASQHTLQDTDPTPIEAHFITYSTDIFPEVSYPQQDMYIVDKVTSNMPGKNPRCVFRTIGWCVFAAHRWRDMAKAKVFKQTLRGRRKCKCGVIFCSCVTHLFVDPARNRPFPLTYFPELQQENELKEKTEGLLFRQVDLQQQHQLTIIGTLVATVICADTSVTPRLPKEMDQFNITTVFWNTMKAFILTGRKVRWTGYLEPSHHVVRQIYGDSSLMRFLVRSSHIMLGCNKGYTTYTRHVRMCGFSSVNLTETVRAFTRSCKMCPLTRLGLHAKNPARNLANKMLRGADDFVSQALSLNPLSTVQCDEAGPLVIGNKQTGFVKIWVLVCVECVTRKVFLIPMKTTSTECFVTALEILQSRRGFLTKLIVDNHSAHASLQSKEQDPLRSVSSILQNMVTGDEKGSHKRLLEQKGIFIAVAESKRHSKVGLAENAIYNLKQTLFHLFPGTSECSDLFEFMHRISLVELFLNQRPVYTDHSTYLTPYHFDFASLKRSQQEAASDIISDQSFPCSAVTKDALCMLSMSSRQMLNQLASELAAKLLNFKNNSHLASSIAIDDWVFVPDRVVAKKRSSLKIALGRVTSFKYPTVLIKMSTGVSISRHMHDIVCCKQFDPERIRIDILDLPLFSSQELPPISDSQFVLTLPEIQSSDSQELITGLQPDIVKSPDDIADEIDLQEITG